MVFIVIGLVGVVALWQRDPRAATAAVVLQLTLTVALIYYLNFKYGFSMLPEQPELAREVRERDYFFIASFATWGLFVALGFGAMMRWMTDFLQTRGTVTGRWAARFYRMHAELIDEFLVDLEEVEAAERAGSMRTVPPTDTH